MHPALAMRRVREQIGRLVPTLVLSVICVAHVTLALIVEWFEAQLPADAEAGDRVGFTVAGPTDGDRVEYVQGIFDPGLGSVICGRRIVGRAHDGDMTGLHEGRAVVLFR